MPRDAKGEQGQRKSPALTPGKRMRRVTAAALLAIGRRCAEGLKHTPVDHAELLYDERGLPR